MKKSFIIILLASSHVLLAQSEIPRSVRINFMDDYISASNARWSKASDEGFQVNFFHQSHFKKALYSHQGVRIALETELTSLAQVPDRVSSVLKKRFEKYSIDKIWQTERQNEVLFNFIVRRDESDIYQLKLLPTGELKHKTKVTVSNKREYYSFFSGEPNNGTEIRPKNKSL